MIRVLVPIEAFARLTLSAAYFALELAKRHPAKVYFLILGTAKVEAGAASGKLQEEELFEQHLERARQQQVNVEVRYSQAEYITAIRQLVAQRGIDDIVIALPPAGDPAHHPLQRRLEQLRHQVQCHIITVKPKDVGPLGLVPRPRKTQS